MITKLNNKIFRFKLTESGISKFIAYDIEFLVLSDTRTFFNYLIQTINFFNMIRIGENISTTSVNQSSVHSIAKSHSPNSTVHSTIIKLHVIVINGTRFRKGTGWRNQKKIRPIFCLFTGFEEVFGIQSDFFRAGPGFSGLQ